MTHEVNDSVLLNETRDLLQNMDWEGFVELGIRDVTQIVGLAYRSLQISRHTWPMDWQLVNKSDLSKYFYSYAIYNYLLKLGKKHGQ
jgi:hypothetical protein